MANERPVMNIVNPPGKGPIIRIDLGAVGSNRDAIRFDLATTEVISVDESGLFDPGGGQAKREVYISYGDLPENADALTPFLYQFQKNITIIGIYVSCDTTTADWSAGSSQLMAVDDEDANAICSAAMTTNPGITVATWTTLGAISTPNLDAGKYLNAKFAKTGTPGIVSGLCYRIEYTLR